MRSSVALRPLVASFAAAVLLVGATAESAAAPVVERGVSVQAPDTVRLEGILSLPEAEFERGEKPPVAILIHDHARTADSLLVLADALAARGIATVRMDQRGHGASRLKEEDNTVYTFPLLPETAIRLETDDQSIVLEHLASTGSVDVERIAVVGVGVGGLVAAETSWNLPTTAAVVALDISDPFIGFDPRRDLGLYGDRPALLVCSEAPRSRALAESLARFGHGERTVHCVDEFDAVDRLIARPDQEAVKVIADWLAKTLGARR
jgi:pimeloyl-ACP methyl ester carboxylesterase